MADNASFNVSMNFTLSYYGAILGLFQGAFEYGAERGVVFQRIIFGQKIFDALVQVLKPQQGAHALTKRILVADHVKPGAPVQVVRLSMRASIHQKPRKIKGYGWHGCLAGARCRRRRPGTRRSQGRAV